MKIKIGIGLDDVYFGFTQKRLRSILGEPDIMQRDSDSDDTEFLYNDIQTTFCFERDHRGLLGWIRTENPACTILGKRIFRMTPEKATTFIENEFGIKVEIRVYSSFTSFFFEDIWLELHCHYGRVKQANFGVLFMDDNRVRWPNIPK